MQGKFLSVFPPKTAGEIAQLFPFTPTRFLIIASEKCNSIVEMLGKGWLK
jgi:hypothetical protein